MVRTAVQADAVQLVDVIYEMQTLSTYARGHAVLNPDRIVKTLTYVLSNPDTQCVLVDSDSDGRMTGLLYGYTEQVLFGDELWFHEQVFYIRQEYRTYPLMRSYFTALQEWCSHRGVCRIQCGNGFTRDPRIDVLYKRLGYTPVNTVYAKRM